MLRPPGTSMMLASRRKAAVKPPPVNCSSSRPPIASLVAIVVPFGTTDAEPTTSTVCEMGAIGRSSRTSLVAPACTVVNASVRSKPARVAATRYRPSGSATIRKWPSPSATTLAISSLSALRTTTCAPPSGIVAPCVVTKPSITPGAAARVCAKPGDAARTAAMRSGRARDIPDERPLLYGGPHGDSEGGAGDRIHHVVIAPGDAGDRDARRHEQEHRAHGGQGTEQRERDRQRPGDVAARKRIRANRERLDEARRCPVDGAVGQRGLLLDEPRRPRLNHAERTKRAELRREDHRPVAIEQCRVSRQDERRGAGGHEQEARHVHNLEIRED